MCEFSDAAVDMWEIFLSVNQREPFEWGCNDYIVKVDVSIQALCGISWILIIGIIGF